VRNDDFLLMRTDSMGVMLWDETYGSGISDEIAYGFQLTSEGGYVLAGRTTTFEATRGLDFYVVRTGRDAMASPAESRATVLPRGYALSVYPNPFNPSTTISFSLPKNGDIRLRVFDVTGRTVAELVDEVLSAGEHSVRLDGAAMSSGIYFTRLQAGGVVLMKKMALVK
jgi:hypothetical protein